MMPKTQWKWKREYSVHPAVVSAINMTYGFEYSSRRALNIAISIFCISSVYRGQRQAEAERRTQSPAMQAVMKQATLAAIRALMPQLEMSARLSGAMAAGDAAICEAKSKKHEQNLNSSWLPSKEQKGLYYCIVKQFITF